MSFLIEEEDANAQALYTSTVPASSPPSPAPPRPAPPTFVSPCIQLNFCTAMILNGEPASSIAGYSVVEIGVGDRESIAEDPSKSVDIKPTFVVVGGTQTQRISRYRLTITTVFVCLRSLARSW